MDYSTGTSKLNIIVCVDENGIFGNSQTKEIPWKHEPFLKEDLKRFQEVTKDSICVMGKNTYLEIFKMNEHRITEDQTSILPNRQCYVISSSLSHDIKGATVRPSLSSVFLDLPVDCDKQIFVLGGRRLFDEALPFVTNIYLSVIRNQYIGDCEFPVKYLSSNFNIVTGETTEHFRIMHYQRVTGNARPTGI